MSLFRKKDMPGEVKAEIRVAQGVLHRVEISSKSLGNTKTIFAIFLPDTAQGVTLPCVYWLSGLTCTDENFSQKAGAFQAACDHKVAIVMPDTSPRGEGIPDEDPKTYDFGVGAGFYLNATQAPYSTHYHMEDFVLKELPAFVQAHFPVNKKASIFGHSMGGHGALTLALKNPSLFESVSAFSPICHPTNCPWGQKAFPRYLGGDPESWKKFDASELIKTYAGKDLHILCDQGTGDNFLKGDVNQLQSLAFIEAAGKANVPVTFRMQAGYDHSYFFISTFVREHVAHHAKYLHGAC
jgi:S-formylglutathione hydrolase